MSKTEYFKNIDYYFTKGRGIALYNCNKESKKYFLEHLENTNYKGINYTISSIDEDDDLSSIEFSEYDYCIIFQDNRVSDLLKIIDVLINKIVFPFYFRGKPILFFSTIDKVKYKDDIESGLIHTDYQFVINKLLIEQLDNIIDRVCFIYSSPEFLDLTDSNYLFTPIEEIMNDALRKENFNYKPQVKIGRFSVDFLLEFGNDKIIIECNGRDFHNPFHDREREKERKR